MKMFSFRVFPRVTILVFLALILFAGTSLAEHYYVNASTGSNTTGTGAQASPWKTITYGLSQISGTGHVLNVASGTYNTTLGETFPIAVKNGVSLVGSGIDVSIIDAGGTNIVLRCVGIVDATTRIEGFTVKGGNVSGTMQTGGSGFYISAGSALTIKDNKITGNSNYSAGYGGGIYVSSSTPLILNNVITGNSPGVFGDGAGIYVANASPVIKGNSIVSNISYGSGIYVTGSSSSPRILNNVIAKNKEGGIECTGSSKARIINNTISDNTGAGVIISYAQPDTILNNIISLNTGYGISESDATSDPGKVWYNLFHANGSGVYQDEGSTNYYTSVALNGRAAEGKNNLDGDPLFLDYFAGDYHVRSGSPAVDGGDPASDYSVEPAPNGGRIEIGAYGNTLAATQSGGVLPTLTDFYVNASTGSNSTGTGSSASPWKTITYALGQFSGPGRTLHVASGTYNRTLGEKFPITVKNGVSLVGAGIDLSIIDAGGTDMVLWCAGVVDAATRVEGLTVKGGNVSGTMQSGGSGFYISGGSALTVTNNKITGNSNYSAGFGGGIYVSSSTPLILDNLITGNSPGVFGDGAGIYVANASPVIKGNSIVSNISYGSGIYVTGSSSSPRILNNVIAKNKEGGIECAGSSKARIINNTITDNTLNGILISYASPDSIVNNIISSNTGYGISEGDATSDPAKVWYNLFNANGSGVYQDEGSTDYYTSVTLNSGVAEAKNNLDGDPMFADYVNGDYHLRGSSPAINAGDPGVPLDSDGSRADIGALSYQILMPTAPSLSSPSDGATSQGTTLTLSWGSSTGATKYHLQVSTSLGFSNIVVDDSTLAGLSRSVGPLATGMAHFWRVRAGNSAGWSGFTTSWSFMTVSNLPIVSTGGATDVASASATLNGSVNPRGSTTNAWFEWGTSSTLSTSTSTASQSIGSGTSALPVTVNLSGLTSRTTYYYRVVGQNGAGRQQGSILSFTTVAGPPHGICVSMSGNDAYSGTASAPLRTIQTALTRASDGDTVKVAAGDYQENVTTSARTVLRGGYDVSFSEATRDVAGNKTILRPTTGTAVSDGRSSEIDGFVFDGTAGVSTGIAVTAGHAIITRNVVFGISASFGKCFHVLGTASSTIRNNTVANNKLSGGGTLVYSIYVTGNADGATAVMNNIAFNNNVGISIGSTLGVASGYNCSSGNSYRDFDGAAATATDISQSPNFRDATTQDYRLASNSPCIDAGDPSTPLDPDGSRADIGAYAYTALPAPPPAPVLSSPADNANAVPLTPTLSWGSSLGATKYHLQVSISSVFSSFVINDSTLTATSTLFGPLANSTMYYWRARAGNSTEWSSFSASWSFTTLGSTQPPTIASFTPSRNALSVDKSNNLTLTFNSDLNSATLTNSTVRINGSLSGLHPGVFSYNSGTRTVTISPTSSFSVGERVTVTATRSILNNAGDSLQKSCTWCFTIKANRASGTFTQGSAPAVGTSPKSIVAGDFDRDGDIDIATGNLNSGTVSILLNNGRGSFTQSSTPSVGNYPYSITAADFDRDGDIDLAVANYSSKTISILRNNGSGAFSQSSTPVAPGSPQSITSGDFNGDGAIDLAVADYGSTTASIFFNTGNGVFALNASVVVGSSPEAITSGDFNGDGYLDLAVARPGVDSTTILLNNGDGSFTKSSSLGVGTYPTSLAAGDFDGDGDLDIAVGNEGANTCSILVNNGVGVFTQSVTPTVGGYPYSIAPADLDGDGDIDLAVANDLVFSTSDILQNDGGGAFGQSSTTSVGMGPGYVVAGDWDGDGVLDLAVANQNSHTVSVLLNAAIVAPSLPTLSSPANNANLQPVTLGLSWGNSEGATKYHLQLSTSSTFSTVNVNDSTITGTSSTVGPLANATMYYWRVRAGNSTGWSDFSGSWAFTTIGAAPSVPTLTSPSDGATAVPLSPTLSWGASAGATSYRLQVSAGSSFTATVLDDSTLTATSRQAGPFSNNTVYYWRVNAKNAGVVSAWSSPRSFTTVVSIPSAPTLITPLDNEVNVSVSPTLNWNAVSGATSYRLQVSAASDFVVTVSDQSGLTSTSKTITGLANGTKYYWRVSASNAGGTGSYSSTRSFTTFFLSPAAPVLSSPANGSSNQPTTLTVTWNASATATKYRLQVSQSSAFASTIVDDSTLTSTSKQIGALSFGATYYWRVSASSAAGTGAFSSTFSFTTAPNPPTTLSLSTSVVFPTKSKASEYLATDYRLIGIPGSSSPALSSILSGTMGVDWQAYWDNGNATNYLVEFDGSSTFQLSVGRAFWVITKGALNINRQVTAPALNSSFEAQIPLTAGWNLITNPFASTIAWSKIQAANNTNAPIYGFTGSFVISANFDPYVGYYFYNGSPNTTLSVLKVPYIGMFSKLRDEPELELGDWRINVALTSGDITDGDTWLGVSVQASPNLDRFDNRKPRGVASLTAAYFERPDWDPDQPAFATDVRPSAGSMQQWSFTTTNEQSKPASLVFRGVTGVPLNCEVYLVDSARARYVDLRIDSIYLFTPLTSVSKFSVLVGRKEFVLQRAVEVLPTQFVLSQNFPNPFNPSTSIAVDVPVEADVSLIVYNALGQEVRRLHTGVLHPGRHWFRWDARDDRRNSVPSGVYYCRMTNPQSQPLVARMLFVK